MERKSIIYISGLIAIVIIGSVGGFFIYQSSIGDDGIVGAKDPYDLSYEQWKHTTNTLNANFSIYDTDKALLWDASSISSISATLKFPEITEGKLSLQLETFGEPLLYYPNEMYIDFKADGRTLLTLERRKYGSFIVSVGNNLIYLMDNTLSLLTFELTWNFTKAGKPMTFALKRHISGGFAKSSSNTISVITKSMGIDEITISTTSSGINSGTLFYLANSFLRSYV